MASRKDPSTHRAEGGGRHPLPFRLCVLLLTAGLQAVPNGAEAQQGARSDPSRRSWANISVLAGRGTSLQRGEHPEHTTLGVSLGADFLRPYLVATGQFRAKFLNQEDVRDPTFACATEDCGPTHRLALQADVYVDVLHLGPIGVGASAGLLAFRGTLSTMVVNHPAFERDATAVSVGPSMTFRSESVYGALAPVWNFRHEPNLSDETVHGGGVGLTGTIRWAHGWFGVYADGRVFRHPLSSETRIAEGDLYAPPPAPLQSARIEDALTVDLDMRVRIRVSHASFLNVGGYFELARSKAVLEPSGLQVPREFRDAGISLSFEFLQY